MKFLLATIALLTVSESSAAQTNRYVVDMDSSSFGFQVEHLGFATVNGVFSTGSGLVLYSTAVPDSISARIELDVESINTNNRLRDKELRSEDFLDAGRYPMIKFSSSGTMSQEDAAFPLVSEGEMVIYGESKQLQLPLNVKEGNGTLTIRSVFSIRRQDFEIDFGILMNSLVSDEIKISVELVAHLEK